MSKGTRSTEAEIQSYILRVIELIRDNYPYSEICSILQHELNKSERQVKVYIQKATESLKNDFNREVDDRRVEFIEGLRKDLKTAYEHFLSADTSRDKNVWFKTYMEIKDRLAKYIPEEQDTENQPITINYNVVGESDEE